MDEERVERSEWRGGRVRGERGWISAQFIMFAGGIPPSTQRFNSEIFHHVSTFGSFLGDSPKADESILVCQYCRR